jgi:hypothetical protein
MLLTALGGKILQMRKKNCQKRGVLPRVPVFRIIDKLDGLPTPTDMYCKIFISFFFNIRILAYRQTVFITFRAFIY